MKWLPVNQFNGTGKYTESQVVSFELGSHKMEQCIGSKEVKCRCEGA